ncbi:MAG: GNAT family N-acetyltransferase [Eggerthellaceae bacterium]|jgi:GNAT superfamily N-acetyltransferase
MGLTFKQVDTTADIASTARIADEIWHEYWPEIIGKAQTDYMVDTMQSVEPIARDIALHGYRYYLLYDENGTCVGYTAARPEDATGHTDDPAFRTHGTKINEILPRKRLFISKIYLYANERGKHYSSRVLEFYEKMCADEGMEGMYLTVNRDNKLGIRAYLGRGFDIIEEVDADIGQGFVMTDHIMEKTLGR